MRMPRWVVLMPETPGRPKYDCQEPGHEDEHPGEKWHEVPCAYPALTGYACVGTGVARVPDSHLKDKDSACCAGCYNA